MFWRSRLHLFFAIALGLGVGLGLTIFRQPSLVSADIPVVEAPGLELQRIKSPSLGIDVEVVVGQEQLLPLMRLSGPAVRWQRFGKLGQNQPMVIQGAPTDYSFQSLDRAQLGDEIFVLGSNGGWYRYRVSGSKWVSYDDLEAVLQSSSEKLILLTVNPWQQHATLVLAQPNR